MRAGADRGVAYALWLRVRHERDRRGWTDVELSERSGVPRPTLDRLARGKRPPAARIVNALAQTLGIDQDEAHHLAGRTPERPPPGTPSVREAVMLDPLYTDQQRRMMLELLDMFEQLGQDDQQRRATG